MITGPMRDAMALALIELVWHPEDMVWFRTRMGEHSIGGYASVIASTDGH